MQVCVTLVMNLCEMNRTIPLQGGINAHSLMDSSIRVVLRGGAFESRVLLSPCGGANRVESGRVQE